MSRSPARGARDPRRLLVIAFNLPPDGFVGGLRWAGITKYLARLGWQVVALTAAPRAKDDPAVSAQVESCPPLWTFVDFCRSLRRRLRRSRGPANASPLGGPSGPPSAVEYLRSELAAFLTFPDQGRGWVLRATLRARSLIRRFQPDVIVSSGPPHSAHLVAAMATIGSSVPWFIDLRDPWAGPLPKTWEPRPRSETWMFRTLTPRLERLAFRAAQRLITTTPQLADVLVAKYPGVTASCIPNGVDAECLPEPVQERYPGLAIAYAGALYVSRDLGPIVRAMRIFFDRHPEAAGSGSKLRVAGHAEAVHALALKDAVAGAGLEQHVEVLGPLPRPQALSMVSRSRLAVVLAEAYEVQIPAKLYESVAMGVPTLVLAGADTATGIEAARLGAVVRDPGDVEGIAGVLEEIWYDGQRLRSPCSVPVTYEALAPFVDQLLRTNGVAKQA